MPNCDFYGTAEDHRRILDDLFAENLCDVYELSSEYEKPLQQFSTTAEVLAQFGRTYANDTPWHTVYLQLYVKGAGLSFEPTRVKLDPDKCDGAAFRYAAEGWGLIQLYLSTTVDNSLRNSQRIARSRSTSTTWCCRASASAK